MYVGITQLRRGAKSVGPLLLKAMEHQLLMTARLVVLRCGRILYVSDAWILYLQHR